MSRKDREGNPVHDLTFFAYRAGDFYDTFLSKHGPLIDRDEPLNRKQFDLVLCNGTACLAHISRLVDCPVIFTSHGPSHQQEVMIPGASAYVCVSEEIAALYPQMTPEVIRNPVDLKRFVPRSRYNRTTRAMIACKNIDAQTMIAQACAKAGFAIDEFHYRKRPLAAPELLIPEFDVLIGTGRTIVEAMASGLTPYVFDFRGGEFRGDGWVDDTNVQHICKVNYSGRCNDYRWDVDRHAEELKKFQQMPGDGRLRGWAEQHHDAKDIVDRYLEIGENLKRTPKQPTMPGTKRIHIDSKEVDVEEETAETPA